ncbi:MAG: class C sortase [Eggerthellaceae bacterium]|nr:class C sortase [Eggerthellaceae bacterium]
MKKHLSTILVALALVAGVCLMAYPTVSDWWNSFHQSRAVASYTDAVSQLDTETYEKLWTDAEAYNQALAGRDTSFVLDDEERVEYEAQLNVEGNGVMAFLEIPVINVSLPIYHGVEESVLQIAIGHIEGTSLPVGGESTHVVVSGHRGLPSARLLTDLDKVVEGDLFMLRTLNETLTYEVDQIRIVEPAEVDEIEIIPGEDLCTLVTCTPYGVNSHRLLVRGHRVPTVDPGRIVEEAAQVSPLVVATVIAVPVIFIMLVVALIVTRKKPSVADAKPRFKRKQ